MDITNPKTYEQFVVSEWRTDGISCHPDTLIEEVPIALVYNGISHVVMMATPQDLADFALGFSLTEGILHAASELLDIEIVEQANGLEVLLTITARRMAQLKQMRRNLTGRTGCGLCGAESLQQAIRPIKTITSHLPISDQAIQLAVKHLSEFQPLQDLTGACHGAAWCNADGKILVAKEDVGRHNALDKLLGALAKQNADFSQGFVLVSSRASYEMVQKVASVGVSVLVSVSAPTAFAVKLAKQSQLTLIGFARTARHLRYNPISKNEETLCPQNN
ncbi:formate dehydrogenase accessory sulfurtransferase FdhD [Paraglaciecola aquimarina]|uniref:Sulfur carrier protein FdhD n=1 Tax=Paraglaciecola aquimarina TaxID=1235557 RepID=A0ABU3ST21_9ALTE|nr:formate dehydrogenase accessory sulfurtransferase FdhD [Paraglaciecola aquimarina]MDU0353161.1 formate dehydrogenase accessory sulfurtransferase FdhD [Paraglaciecola aquimarina]